MAFNEFRQLADNPPRKEEPTIFKVAVYDIDTFEMDQESENGDKESPRHREYGTSIRLCGGMKLLLFVVIQLFNSFFVVL